VPRLANIGDAWEHWVPWWQKKKTIRGVQAKHTSKAGVIKNVRV